MHSDPISESTPKRRKVNHDWEYGNDSADELFDDITEHDTVATLPLSQRPAPQLSSQRPGPQNIFANIMSELQSPIPQSYATQPTQPMNGRSGLSSRSTPSVQVARSSPAPPSSPSSPAKATGRASNTFGSAMAPPGTVFKRPIPRPQTIDLSLDDSLVDPPVQPDSDDDVVVVDHLKSTNFTKGGRTLDSSPNRVQDSPPLTGTDKFKKFTAQWAHHPQPKTLESAGAYGNSSRQKPRPQARQAGPARAQPIPDDYTLDMIPDYDVRYHVGNMMKVCGTGPGRSIRDLEQAFMNKKGNYEDALAYVFAQDDVIDLASSDIESGASKSAARPVAKQHVMAPSRTIGEKYSSTQRPVAKQEVKAPSRTIQDKYSNTRPLLTSQQDEEVKKPRRRLVQGRKHASSPAPTPPPAEKAPTSRKAKRVVDSGSDMDSGIMSDDSEIEIVESNSLLHFFNTCSVQDLADLANEKPATAEFILSNKPFKSLNAIRILSDAQPTKTGKKRVERKPIGEKVVDICEDMWEGYEAVDELVHKCNAVGKPIAETMQKWGMDLQAASKDGELALTKLEDTSHDSGIGTPASSVDVDDDIVSPVKNKKGAFLKQPSIMSTTDVVMKDYQLVGLNWLNLLWSKKLSCILADDMGLGKTCQVISFLAHLRETNVEGVHLVVVPGSTLENWLREFNRFCPSLHVEPYYGSQADRAEQRVSIGDNMGDIDVVVTTYETATGRPEDNAFLRKVIRPTVAVFDEGHALKNRNSKRHRELMRIPAKFRLLLTGTPLQNNLQELASLLAFILPDIFNEHSEGLDRIFKYKATTKDADHAALLSAQRIARARSMMTPFILRRKKQQVLKDIPAKHCRVEYCDMVPDQRQFYEERKQAAVQSRDEPQRSGAKTHHMMALRQAAIHPLLSRRFYDDDKLRKLQKILINNSRSELQGNREDLVWKFLTVDTKGGDFGLHKFCAERADYIPAKFTLQDEEWMSSGKVQKLRELLERFIANGDKILLFSQFTSMMDILEAVFETLSIKFMRLDGSTEMARRQDIIDQFTADNSIPVFMLSTKAGGAGINLACANKVVIFDSSFNPQEDVQAENRAHRVGQTREVEVVRLVTRDTIEVQIHALGESKLALDERVAGEAGAGAGAAAEEKEGEKMVERMFFESLDGGGAADLRGQFRDGLKKAGLEVGCD